MSKIVRMITPLAILLFAAMTATAQICTPDSQYTEVGLYPDSLAPASIGAAYEQVVHVVIPQDTIVETAFGTLTVDLCALTLDSIPNLPDGLMYECSGGSCTWDVDHTPGAINRVCVKISGTPTEVVAPDDSLVVYATVTAGAFNANTNTCDPLTITLPDSLTTIIYKTQLKITNSTSLEAELNPLQLTLFPNPSQSGLSTLSFDLPAREQVEVNIRNVQGQIVSEVANQQMSVGSHEISLEAQSLPSGMYIIEIQAGELRQHKSWILE